MTTLPTHESQIESLQRALAEKGKRVAELEAALKEVREHFRILPARPVAMVLNALRSEAESREGK